MRSRVTKDLSSNEMLFLKKLRILELFSINQQFNSFDNKIISRKYKK